MEEAKIEVQIDYSSVEHLPDMQFSQTIWPCTFEHMMLKQKINTIKTYSTA